MVTELITSSKKERNSFWCDDFDTLLIPWMIVV